MDIEEDPQIRETRLQDVLSVVVEKMFTFHGADSQLAISLIDCICGVPENQGICEKIKEMVIGRKEFELCRQFIPQKQLRYVIVVNVVICIL